MRLQIKHLLAGSVVLAGASLIGCSTHSDAPYYGAEPVQTGYAEYPSNYAVAEDPYYDQGGYSGDYWVWHDREGHEYREARAAHEQRARSYERQRGEQFNHEEHADHAEQGAIRNEGNRGAENGAYGPRRAEGQAAGHAEAGRGERGGGAATVNPGAEGHGGGAGGEAHREGGEGEHR